MERRARALSSNTNTSKECEAFGPQAPREIQFEWFVPLGLAAPALAAVADEAAGWGGGLALYCEVWCSRDDAAVWRSALALSFKAERTRARYVPAAARRTR